MVTDKAWVAVETAVNHLEEALTAYARRDMDRARLRVWDASAEAEYALFLLELDHAETETLEKESRSKKEITFEAYVLKAQELLKTALKDHQSQMSRDLLRNLRLARGLLVALQEKIEKGKL